MSRHRLASLFEPRTLWVLADAGLRFTERMQAWKHPGLTVIPVLAGRDIVLPARDAPPPSDRLDQAVVCVAPDQLPAALAALKTLKPRTLVILSHPSPARDPVQDRVFCQSWGRLNDCRVLGPRSFGLQRPHLGLNLSHEHGVARSGRVALVAQSRSLVSAVLDWARDIDMGFSCVVAMGDEADLDVANILDYLALDARTDSIALYLEDASSSRRFTSALRAAASVKPVVILKTGHNPDEAVLDDVVFNAVVRRAGAVRIRYFVQLFSALKALSYAKRPRGRRVALFSNGHGAAQLALDVMGPATPIVPAELAPASLGRLRDVLGKDQGISNPVLAGDPLTPRHVADVLKTLDADSGVDGVLVLLTPDPLADMDGVARQLAQSVAAARKPVVTCLLGDSSMRGLRRLLDGARAPAFRTPESAANAFGVLSSYHYNQTLSQQTLPPEPLGKSPDLRAARALVRQAQAQRRQLLSDHEAQRLLACFHIPLRYIRSKQELDSAEALPMAIRSNRYTKYGPYLMFGSGGRDDAIARGNRAVDLPPLNGYLARQLIQRSSLWRRGLSRQMTPAAFELLRECLEGLSELITELPELMSLAIDPLYADDDSIAAVKLRIAVDGNARPALPENDGYRHMAIHPYPRRLVQSRTLKDGRPWTLRPIRPEDAQPLQDFIRDLSDESRYMRFVSMLRELTPAMLARYTRIDYDRELAMVATVQAPDPDHRGHPKERIVGFSHYLRHADGRGAEYALVIADDWQRKGLGAQLMGSLIEAARIQGLTYIDGSVLSSNRPMLSLMAHLGFQVDPEPEDPTMRRVWLDLRRTRPGPDAGTR